MVCRLPASQDPAATNVIERCDHYFEAGDYLSSAAMARAILKEDPQNGEAAWRLSRALIVSSNLETDKNRRRDTLEDALVLAESAVTKLPESHHAHTCLAICKGNLTNLVGGKRRIELAEGARTSAVQAAKLEPDNFMAYMVLGVWHREMATLSGFTRLLAAVVYGGLPEGASLEESERCLRRAAELAPDRINPHRELGITLVVMKKYEEAEPFFEKAVSLAIQCPDDKVYRDDARDRLKAVRRKLK
jgi:tetratricopeptide (TPR) repeat protein